MTCVQQRIKYVGRCRNAPNERNCLSRQSIRIVFSAVLLVMRQRNLGSQAHQFGLAVLGQIVAETDVGLQDARLLGVELAGPVQDAVGHTDFADVVHGRREQLCITEPRTSPISHAINCLICAIRHMWLPVSWSRAGQARETPDDDRLPLLNKLIRSLLHVAFETAQVATAIAQTQMITRTHHDIGDINGLVQ